MNQKNALVLYDGEQEYVTLLSEYLGRQKGIPWEIRTYTELKTLLEYEKGPVCMLVVAESAFTEAVEQVQAERIVILNESGMLRFGKYPNTNKYQMADLVLKDFLELYAEIASLPFTRIKQDAHTRLLGFFSPIRRCMQTTLSLCMAHILAEKHAVLYINFEQFAENVEQYETENGRDLSDLLYFMNADAEKFPLRLQTMISHREGVDYLPPVKYGTNLLTVSPAEWLQLLEKITDLKEYDYVLLDLSESLQGLPEILRACSRVYTIVKNDRISRGKLYRYEKMLAAYSCDEVNSKTVKCAIPNIKRLPEGSEQFRRGELAEYAKGLLKEGE